MGNISMMTMHGSAIVNERGAWLYVMNRASTLDMINTYFNVYSKPITDGIFDRNQSFNDEEDSIVNQIYWAAPDDDAGPCQAGRQNRRGYRRRWNKNISELIFPKGNGK